MKKLSSFFASAVVALLLVALPVSVLAASGVLKIEVSPINVLVDGKMFQPKDANGNDVMVFTYNGTTYAPLRALAEAYGLEVGYDSSRHLATINSLKKQNDVSSSDFKSAWIIKEKPVTNYGSEKIFTAIYNGDLDMGDFKAWWKSFSEDEIASEAEQLAAEAQGMNPGYTVTMYFSYGQHNLGTAFAYGDYEFSNFTVADAWIK